MIFSMEISYLGYILCSLRVIFVNLSRITKGTSFKVQNEHMAFCPKNLACNVALENNENESFLSYWAYFKWALHHRNMLNLLLSKKHILYFVNPGKAKFVTMETSQFIWAAKELTGFYLIATLTFKWVNKNLI